MSNTVEQKLFNEIDKICKSTDLLQTLPLGEKVKLLEFRTHLCDLNGATKDALNIVVKAEDSDDKIRTYFIEINGALAKTVAQSSTETYGNAVAFGIASAILAENWDNPFAWFMAVVTAGAYHAFGKVTAIPLGDKAEKEAKIVAANLYDSYIDLVKNDKDGNLTIQTDKSEIDTFTKENMENILIKLPSDANLTIVHSGGNYAIDINASKKEINIDSSINLNEKNKESENFAGAILSSGAEVATINSHTYNIKQLSNLELRNAIDYIPKVSFLLSNILVKAGETIDLGSKGLYKVKSGDTLSTIAQKNGFITKDLLKLNPHLIDEGRLKFSQNKVLISANPSNLNNKNHTLQGDDNAENLLVDSNGGDNVFIGGNKKDTMKSTKEGYDTYHAGDKDIIIDNDHNGEVIFDGIKLNGGVWDENKQAYIDSSNNSISYKLNESTLTLTISKGSKTLTIKNYDINKQSLNISLSKNPGKEVAIVIDTTGSMYDDIEAAKESAKAIAQNIFRSNLNNNEPNNKNSEVYSKISIVTFSDNNIKTLGSYNNYNSFQKGINQVYEQGGGREYHCAAILEGMSNFTKDNGLSKEIYLMTDESGDDNHRMSEVINKAKNFGSSISLRSAFNDKSKFDNSVKINIISINNNHLNLKKLSDETNGLYLQPNSIDELKDALFDISNQGTSKDETIIGNDKNNTINGKGGNDTLKGLKGDDTYLFEGSFENDTIIDNEGKNKIVFKDRSVNDIDFVKVKDDLFLVDYKTKSAPANYVKITNFFNSNNTSNNNKTPNITNIKFTDYTITKDILTLMSNNSQNTYNFLNDNSNNFYIDKGKGKFIVGHKNKENLITTNNYDDVVIGGDKNDIIKTNSGNDVIIGNKGDDILISKFGNDTYIFNLGDGNDTIIDNKGKDTIKFNGDIKNLNFTKIADDLVIKYSLDDSVTIKDHFKNKKNNIAKIELNNNSFNELLNNNENNSDIVFNKNENNSFISQNTINKIIQDLNSYSNNKGLNLSFGGEFKNSDIMQVYNF